MLAAWVEPKNGPKKRTSARSIEIALYQCLGQLSELPLTPADEATKERRTNQKSKKASKKLLALVAAERKNARGAGRSKE
jgi:hypothetical protein